MLTPARIRLAVVTTAVLVTGFVTFILREGETPSVTAVPGGASSAQGLFFSFSMFDPEDPSAEITIPDSGVLAKFVVRSAAGATPGNWGIVAAVEASDEVVDPVSTELAGMDTTLVAVPEPETYALFGAGLVMLGLGMVRRRAR